MESEACRAAAEAARSSYGKLLARLAAQSRDIAAAEDALADAFHAALRVWPERGVPDHPEAWLLTAARHRLSDGYRHGRTREAAEPALRLLADEREAGAEDRDALPDARLKLMFICAHPAIEASVRTPLMLQTILGLDAARIGSAFLVSPAAMGQRLTRAKAKIRDAGIAFEVPERKDLPGRLAAVLDAIYAAYGTAWDDVGGADARRKGLAGEAIYLARLIVSLMPEEPEARGLMALLLYCEARSAARRTADGAFVPLAEQDAKLWSRDLIIEAENHLTLAARQGVFGRFQTEAAIQSVHVQRPLTGVTNHKALVVLYDLLALREPSIGALVSRAAAHGEAFGPERGLALLDELPAKQVEAYQPYWAARAHLLGAAGDVAEAAKAFDRASALSDDPAVQDFLRAKKAALGAWTRTRASPRKARQRLSGVLMAQQYGRRRHWVPDNACGVSGTTGLHVAIRVRATPDHFSSARRLSRSSRRVNMPRLPSASRGHSACGRSQYSSTPFSSGSRR